MKLSLRVTLEEWVDYDYEEELANLSAVMGPSGKWKIV
jgi:hypothetical protein